MDFSLFFFTSAMMLIMEQAVCTSYLQVPVSSAERGLSIQLRTRAQHRQKRCSCDNLKDKECVYFCHIGIVWVNTPSQVIPYGVGSYKMRLRRDVRRCLCKNQRDTTCQTFCFHLYSQGENEVLRDSHRLIKGRFKATAKERQRYTLDRGSAHRRIPQTHHLAIML